MHSDSSLLTSDRLSLLTSSEFLDQILYYSQNTASLLQFCQHMGPHIPHACLAVVTAHVATILPCPFPLTAAVYALRLISSLESLLWLSQSTFCFQLLSFLFVLLYLLHYWLFHILKFSFQLKWSITKPWEQRALFCIPKALFTTLSTVLPPSVYQADEIKDSVPSLIQSLPNLQNLIINDY